MLRNYFAGFEYVAEVVEPDLLPLLPYRLVSFYYMAKMEEEKLKIFFSKRYRESRFSLMLDSGAFTVWKKNREKKPDERKEKLELSDYVEYCCEWQKYYNYFVCLDQIPEDLNNETSINDAAEISQSNYLKMVESFKEKDMDPSIVIPVYHQGEDIKYLQWMLENNIPYIGLSPSNAIHDRDEKAKFLNACFHTIKKSGKRVKTHAFGLSSYDLLGLKPNGKRRFPFYSADATTWGDQALKAQIIVPKKKKQIQILGKWDYSQIESVKIGSIAKKLRDSQYYLAGAWPQDRATMSKPNRINEYIRDFGYHIGYSTIRERLKGIEDEKWESEEYSLDPRTQKSYLKKKYGEPIRDDIIVTGELRIMSDEKPRIGITHYTQWRMIINVKTTNEWVKTLGKPEPPDPDETPEEIEKRKEVDQKIYKSLNRKKAPTFKRTK